MRSLPDFSVPTTSERLRALGGCVVEHSSWQQGWRRAQGRWNCPLPADYLDRALESLLPEPCVNRPWADMHLFCSLHHRQVPHLRDHLTRADQLSDQNVPGLTVKATCPGEHTGSRRVGCVPAVPAGDTAYEASVVIDLPPQGMTAATTGAAVRFACFPCHLTVFHRVELSLLSGTGSSTALAPA